MNQIAKQTVTTLPYPERSVFMKEVNTQNFWKFELGTQERVNVSIWLCVVFQQSDRQHDQKLNNDTFVRLPVKSTQVVIGTKRSPRHWYFINL